MGQNPRSPGALLSPPGNDLSTASHPRAQSPEPRAPAAHPALEGLTPRPAFWFLPQAPVWPLHQPGRNQVSTKTQVPTHGPRPRAPAQPCPPGSAGTTHPITPETTRDVHTCGPSAVQTPPVSLAGPAGGAGATAASLLRVTTGTRPGHLPLALQPLPTDRALAPGREQDGQAHPP